MNKIFKVIWNKTKHCYVVASELAKQHTKSPKSITIVRVILSGLLACIVSFGLFSSAYARIYTAGGGVVDVAEGLRDHIVIGTGAHAINVINGVDDEKNNMIVIGDHMRANGEGSIAIGGTWQTDEWSSDDKVGAWGSNHILMGENSYTSGLNNVSLGAYNRSEGTNVVNIGNGSKSVGNFVLNLGANSNSTGNYIVNVGTGARSLGNNSAVLGNSSVSFAEGGTAIGSDVGVYENAINSVAIGRDSNATEADVVSFGHRNGEIWAPSSEGNGNGTTNPTYFDSDYYRRLINVAAGTEANNVAIVDQTGNSLILNNKTLQLKNVLGTQLSEVDLSGLSGDTYTPGSNISIDDGVLSAVGLIKYDNENKKVATLEGAGGTKLTNLKQATLSRTSTDAVIGAQLYATNKNIEGFAQDIRTNANNITNLNTSVTNALGSVSAISTSVDTINDVKADASLNNLTSVGRQVIATAAFDAVQEYMRSNNQNVNTTHTLNSTQVNSSVLHTTKFGLTANPVNDTEIVITNDDLNDAGDNTINQAVQDALDTKVEISDFNDALDLKADTDAVYSKNETNSLLNTKADALYVDEKLSLKANKEDVYSKEEANDLLGLKADKSALDEKANINASNVNVDDWAKVLGIGEIAEGNTHLVNGGTVYNALQNVKNNDIIAVENHAIRIGNHEKYENAKTIDVSTSSGQGRTITGVVVNPEDAYSVANIGYVDAVGENIIHTVNREFRRVDDKISDVGANAAAMSALMPVGDDANKKWSLSAAVGHYDSTTASAVGLFYKPSDNVIVNVRGTVGSDENMLAGGVSVALDKGSVPGVSKAQLVREINVLKEKDKQRDAEMEQMRQQIVRLTLQVNTQKNEE